MNTNAKPTTTLTPAEYGRQLAAAAPPLTDGQVEAAARILAAVSTPTSTSRVVRTRAEAIAAAGAKVAASRMACAQMTPREQAEAAWTPTSRLSVDELEQRIRAERGLAPRARSTSGVLG